MTMSDHHDHHLPPPEPDHINAASITFWGILSFVTVLGTVVGLSDYFWLERENAAYAKIEKYADGSLRAQQAAEATDKLNSNAPLIAVVNGAMVEGYYASEDAAKAALVQGSIEDVNARRIVTADQVKRTRLPIKRAMELVVAERAKPMAKPAPLVKPVAQSADAQDAAMEETVLEPNAELVAQGKALFHNPAKMCATCHSIDGTRLVGPTMKGAWNRVEELEGGAKVRVNRAYFINSIKKPASQIVKGYPNGMPAMLATMLTDAEIEALMYYVASLK